MFIMRAEIPSLPKPRDKYVVKAHPNPNDTGKRGRTVYQVFHRANADCGLELICEYSRNYDLLQTFEPFRQGDREFALISQNYSRTAVLDLLSGEIVAEEGSERGDFCPVGFYVPDWWDVHSGSIVPGCERWTGDYEWQKGDFGFVWGCIWGDDSTWKVQHLDLSRIAHGEIVRRERYGYVELETSDYRSPCFEPDLAPPANSTPPQFIKVAQRQGIAEVTFAVPMKFDLQSGEPEDWRRVRVKKME